MFQDINIEGLKGVPETSGYQINSILHRKTGPVDSILLKNEVFQTKNLSR